MNQKNIIMLVVLIVVVAGAVLLGYKMKRGEGYSVVYMTTGQIFVGKLNTFPDLQLTDAYLFQTTPNEEDPKKSDFKLNPVKDALWAPKSIHLIKDNVSFYGPLMSDSSIAKALAEQKK